MNNFGFAITEAQAKARTKQLVTTIYERPIKSKPLAFKKLTGEKHG